MQIFTQQTKKKKKHTHRPALEFIAGVCVCFFLPFFSLAMSGEKFPLLRFVFGQLGENMAFLCVCVCVCVCFCTFWRMPI